MKLIRTLLIMLLGVSFLVGCGSKSQEPNDKISNESFEDIFSALNGMHFTFSSGAGAWSTDVTMKESGYFTGYYHDSNMGDIGTDYPNGTVYESIFEGKFTVIKKIDDFTYSMKLDEFEVKGEVDEEKIVDGTKTITTAAYGFDNADEFLLYLPGKNISDLPEEFLSWVQTDAALSSKLPFYGLYNVEGKMGFFSDLTSDNIIE